MKLLTMTRSEIARLQTCQWMAAGIMAQADAASRKNATADAAPDRPKGSLRSFWLGFMAKLPTISEVRRPPVFYVPDEEGLRPAGASVC